MNRLTHLPTLRIRPEKKVSVIYRGKTYEGAEGDSIAAILYANGIRIFGRSLKYHRPRGLYSMDGECSNSMMAVDGIPNVRTETTVAKSGMNVEAQNVVGTAEFDAMAFMDKLSFAMPAGFYYKMFHKPAAIWPHAIKQIRKAAGLGKLSPDFEMKGSYDQIAVKTDVCVIGGGPAGMRAALAAAESGMRVILLESRQWLGGVFEYRPALNAEGKPLFERARELAEKVEASANIRVFKHTSMVGSYNNNLITAFQRGGQSDTFDERYVQIRAESVVVATGCIERPLLFDHNERPGIMQVSCAHRLARTYGIVPGKEAVFSIGHDLGLEAAIDLADLGLKVLCVADVREDGQDPALLAALAERGITIYKGWSAAKAKGCKLLNGVVLKTLDGNHSKEFECDTLVASAGLTPVTGPFTLALAKLKYDDHTGYFLPENLPVNMFPAGRVLGLNKAESIEASGHLAGLKAAAGCGASVNTQAAEDALAALPGAERGSKFVCASGAYKKTFICFDEDATVKNMKQAMGDGFDVPELMKRFSSAGTGPGQGGIPGHNLPLFVAHTQDSPDTTPRPTTVRPPLVPVYLATYAGANHDMSKRTAMHDRQVADGGVMERIGVWNRARRFSLNDKTARAEIENVRNNVGLLDGSTLGKFRIFGPDALKALERVYVSNMSKVKEGRIKYSAMCNEDGCVIDDGVVTKIGENDYYFTTSTGRAGGTIEWIRYHTRYEGWNFSVINLTDAFGVINLAGPNARKVLEKVTDADVSKEALPFSAYREFKIKDVIPVKVMSLGFVGELSYELHVPGSYMQSLWEILEDAGKEFNIKNFGLEAQSTMRMEKGHVILGSESEQRTTLHDIGMGFLWCKTKPEAKTVGNIALQQTKEQKGRLKLVGIKLENPSQTAPRDGSPIVDSRVRGYVCTSRFSYALGEPVAMALVDDELAAVGTRIGIYEDECGGQLKYAKVVPMPFYDPTGGRMKS